MAELVIDRVLTQNSLDRPVGFHWTAIVDSVVAVGTGVAGIAVVDTAVGTVVVDIEVADIAVAGIAVVDIAVVDIAARTVVVESFAAAANRRLG